MVSTHAQPAANKEKRYHGRNNRRKYRSVKLFAVCYCYIERTLIMPYVPQSKLGVLLIKIADEVSYGDISNYLRSFAEELEDMFVKSNADLRTLDKQLELWYEEVAKVNAGLQNVDRTLSEFQSVLQNNVINIGGVSMRVESVQETVIDIQTMLKKVLGALEHGK